MEEQRFPLLKATAKIVLGTPGSSAVVERLFTAAGLLLRKLRKCMLPALVINSVYIRFGFKIRIIGIVKGLPGSTELCEPINEQEIEDVLNECHTEFPEI